MHGSSVARGVIPTAIGSSVASGSKNVDKYAKLLKCYTGVTNVWCSPRGSTVDV